MDYQQLEEYYKRKEKISTMKAMHSKAMHGRRIYGWKSKNLRALSRNNESVDKRRGRGRGREQYDD